MENLKLINKVYINTIMTLIDEGYEIEAIILSKYFITYIEGLKSTPEGVLMQRMAEDLELLIEREITGDSLLITPGVFSKVDPKYKYYIKKAIDFHVVEAKHREVLVEAVERYKEFYLMDIEEQEHEFIKTFLILLHSTKHYEEILTSLRFLNLSNYSLYKKALKIISDLNINDDLMERLEEYIKIIKQSEEENRWLV